MLTRMLQRRGTTAQWEDVKSTLILSSGEVGFVTDGADKDKFKIGDGVTTWENLEFYLRDDQNAGIYSKLIATQTFQGSQVLTPSTSIVVPLVVSGAASQSADLQRWRDSSNNTLASVDATGKITATGGLFNSTVNVNSNKITNVAAPTDASDATNKQYVDDAIAGLAWKTPVNLVSATALNTFVNVPLTGNTGTVTLDGHPALTQAHGNGYRLLLLAQTTSSDNGIYLYTDNGTTYTLTRAVDADVYTELKGASVFVEEGTSYGTSSWVQTNHYITSFANQNWVQFNGASQITAGSGLTKTGNVINAIGTTDRITANADSIDIASTYVGQASITTLGTVGTGSWRANTLDTDKGGTGITSYAVGDISYATGTSGATQLSKLAIGTAKYVLKVNDAGTAPTWGQIQTAALENASNTLTGVTYAKMQYVSAQYKLLGRISSGSGVVEELSADDMITMLNTASTNKINTARLNTLSGGNYGTSTSVAKADHTHTLDDLSDVVITTPANRQVLKFNGTNWINELPSGGISVSATAPAGPSSGDAWMDSNDGSLYVYYNDTTSRPAGTNIVRNPSLETNTTDWAGVSATVAQSSAQYYVGTKSLLVTPSATTGGARVSITGLSLGSNGAWVISAYVYSNSNKNLRIRFDGTGGNIYTGSTVAVPYNTWTRLSLTIPALTTAGPSPYYFYVEGTDSTDAFYVDAVMMEQTTTLNDYFDGSSYNATWSGTAHASSSSTAGGTTSQWVQVRANSALEATILTRMSAVESRATNLEAANPVVVGSVAARSALFPAPVQGNTVFRTDLGYMERYYTAYDAVNNPSGTTGTVGWYEYRGGAALSENKIINGAFDIWQRGTSFSFSGASGQYTADRFAFYTDGTGAAVTVSQQTFTPGTAPVASTEGRFFARINRTAAGTGGTYSNFQQAIEDVRSFAGQTVSLSFWAKADASRTVTAFMNQDFGTGGSSSVPTASQSFSVTTSWQKFTATFTLPGVSGKTISSTDSKLWAYISTPNVISYIDIWGVQVEQGPVASVFRRNQPNIQAELAACQRYYEKSYRQATVPGTADSSGCFDFRTQNAASATLTLAYSWQFKTVKRSVPNIRLYNAYDGTADRVYVNGSVTPVINTVGDSGASWYIASLAIGANTDVAWHYTADAEL